jgi:hypothetical protein
MDLKYTFLYQQTSYADNIRKTLYKEKTNVLAYYIITLIFINNYQDFLFWCYTNNTSLLQFKKSISNQESICEFIEKKYKSKSLLNGINCSEKLLYNFNKFNTKTNTKTKTNTNRLSKDIHYLVNNLRMTICELG